MAEPLTSLPMDFFVCEGFGPAPEAGDSHLDLERCRAHDLMPRYFAAPLFVLWEITGRCPLDCGYCYNASPKRVRELNPEKMREVADELIALQVFGACITGGEPMARADFLPLIEHLAAGGVTVSVTTNGWYIDSEMARQLARVTNAVTISIDGATADMHDRVRRRKGSFERVLRAIGHLHDAGVSQVGAAFACTADNAGDYQGVLELADQLGLTCVRSQLLAVTGKALLNPGVAAVAIERYEQLRRVADSWNEEHAAGVPLASWQDPSGHIREGLRLGRVVGLRITAEGYLGFTPHVPYVMGDVSVDSVAAVWRRGLRVGWRHPVVRRELSGVRSAADLGAMAPLSPADPLGYRHLDPEEAEADP